MNKAEIIIKMVNGHEVYTTYSNLKFHTARIDNVDIDPELFREILKDSDNIICSHWTPPDIWAGDESLGSAIYKYDLAKIT